jgi:hypothetical protein
MRMLVQLRAGAADEPSGPWSEPVELGGPAVNRE